jgi:hypothetical protein
MAQGSGIAIATHILNRPDAKWGRARELRHARYSTVFFDARIAN